MSEKAVYRFGGREYALPADLARAMGQSWREGRRFLLDGSCRAAVRETEAALAAACAAAEREAQAKPREKDRIFLKWLCACPGIRSLLWRGKDYGGPGQILACLEQGDRALEDLLLFMLRERMLHVLAASLEAGPAVEEALRYLEKACAPGNARFSRDHALALLRCVLNDNGTLLFDGGAFRTPAELAAHLQPIADRSRAALSKAVRPLFDDPDGMAPALEAWLLLRGFGHELQLYDTRFRNGQKREDAIGDIFYDEDEDLPEPEDIAETSPEGFEDLFSSLLRDHRDRLDDPVSFGGLLADYFPQESKRTFLLHTLYRMDILKALREEGGADELALSRFSGRLETEYGVSESAARWAVGVWQRCFAK